MPKIVFTKPWENQIDKYNFGCVNEQTIGLMIKSIEPYNPNWEIEYNNIREIIQSALKSLNVDIQHVGSTSIPGVFAKPILDIDIIIQDKSLLQEITSRLERIGYMSKGEQGISGRFAFRQISEFAPLSNSKEKWQPHHLYICYKDSLALKNHLRFRDALRNSSDLAESYSQLKKTLAKDQSISREQYTMHKTHFILSVLAAHGFSKGELKEINDANHLNL